MSTTSPQDNLPVWDEQAAMASTGGDPALARTLTAQLVGQLPGDLAEMRRLAAAADYYNLAEKAHKTRGGALYCGVPALVAALEQLDRSARGGDAALAMESLARVADEIRRLQGLELARVDAGP
jgi:HPt (histidine-containing phosphotransfer) domain-containing protein